MKLSWTIFNNIMQVMLEYFIWNMAAESIFEACEQAFLLDDLTKSCLDGRISQGKNLLKCNNDVKWSNLQTAFMKL